MLSHVIRCGFAGRGKKKPSHEEAKPSLRTRMSNQIAERHRKGSKSFQNRSRDNENGGYGASVDKQKSVQN